MIRGLIDLDELVLRCRDTQSRELIAEAIAAYHAGAYRAAVVTIWLAVYFDLAAKFRSLAIAGNAEARDWVAEHERYSNGYNPERPETASNLLRIEREILNTAVSPAYEVISHAELADIKRIRTDRNRCAHPTMQSVDERFQPSAELVRAHIRNAITYILARPPMQGRIAVERYLDLCADSGFPLKTEEALDEVKRVGFTEFSESNLDKLLSDLLDATFDPALTATARTQRFVGVEVLHSLSRTGFESSFATALNSHVRRLYGEKWAILASLLTRWPWAWDHMDVITRNRTVLAIKATDLDIDTDRRLIVDALCFEPLTSAAFERLSYFSTRQLTGGYRAIPDEFLLDQGIKRLFESNSFEQTRQELRLLIMHRTGLLNADRTARILDAYLENRQIGECVEVTTFLNRLLSELPMDKLGSREKWLAVRAERAHSHHAHDRDLVGWIGEYYGGTE
jgi:hypothetical protein